MRIKSSHKPTRVAIIGCQHGNEHIGRRVFKYYEHRLADYPGLTIILANEEAIAAGKRCIDADMNRSFPGNPSGNHEERLAAELLPIVREAEYVLDLHTTSCEVGMVPIVANVEAGVRRVINLTGRRDIVLMKPGIAGASLIGNVGVGVSLEFNEQYAASPDAIDEVEVIIGGLLNQQQNKEAERYIYAVDATIPLKTVLGANDDNFTYSRKLQAYPFLLHEREYTQHQGFLAKTRQRKFI
ncbi:succinylglutamate desuccinylase/aspartoacylase family protein [Candidatus Saccharibacteria bacterium]|nr:succinylglutamate desuccinylase/aspartoacylase family protein [Candidatus Saccharibacteria bacterium]